MPRIAPSGPLWSSSSARHLARTGLSKERNPVGSLGKNSFGSRARMLRGLVSSQPASILTYSLGFRARPGTWRPL